MDAQSPTGAPDWVGRIRRRLAGSVPDHERAAWLLPGLTAQQTALYRRYFPPHPVAAAVLIPVIARADPTVLLTQRSADLRHHAGQISFPGGRIEAGDAGPAAAALREAREEVGLEADFVEISGYLPDHITPSGFRITPVVGIVRPGFTLRLDSNEVAELFEVPLAHVFDPARRRPRTRRFGPDESGEEAEVQLCDIPWEGRIIWGATAGMLITLQRECA